MNLQKEHQMRKEEKRRATAWNSIPTTPVKRSQDGQTPVTPESNKPIIPNNLNPIAPEDLPTEEDDDFPENLLLDPAMMLPFQLPSSTDMLISYGAGFGGVNRERERKYIPTVPPEFLTKLDQNGGRAQSTYNEKDWENESL